MAKNHLSLKNIYIASDHAGFDHKTFLVDHLSQLGFKVIDLGCNSAEKSVDYPDYAEKLCQKIGDDFGILVCGSGVGISIAANRFKNVRAALCHSVKVAKLSRLHNDANVLCLGARIKNEASSFAIAKTFLKTKFEGGRHEKRVAKLG
jgi:ribose 5-phosphate isomerase B